MGSSLTAIHIEDGVNGYVDLVHHVLEHGREASPRGVKTREIEDATVFIDNVYDAMPMGVGRGVVPGIGAVEACQLVAGKSTPRTVIAVGPQFTNYAENNGEFHGAYGLRTNGQYAHVVDKIKSDPDTRQAVVTIWNPEFDNMPQKRDYPCTVLHQFRVRDGRLNMSVYMRSNDVWLGAAYDFFQFTRVQLAICSILGIEPGTYAHHVGSLHIYESNIGAVTKLRKTSAPVDPIPYFAGSSWADVALSAQNCLLAVDPEALHVPELNDTELWYVNAMRSAIESNEAKLGNA
jgi:thymidylate synthase